MNISNQTKREIVNKIYELFFLVKYKYLLMYPNGVYQTHNKYEHKNFKPLQYWQIESHLKGERTLGVFAANYNTRFISFDVDVQNRSHAKWVTYKLINELINLGIPKENIYPSTSGNKGYHVEIYFNQPVQNEIIKDFYDIVMTKIDLSHITGQIELRPTNQGLKIPLGVNFKNKNENTNRCWYVNIDDLQPIESFEYILTIEQIDPIIINEIIFKEKDMFVFAESVTNEEAENIESSKGFIDSRYKPLKNYQVFNDEKITIEYIKTIEEQGIKQVGTRHNYLLTLCRYYKYLGMAPEENESSLIDWIDRQNPERYTTKIEESYKEISNMVKHAYDNDISLIMEQKDITIYYSEMLEIMKAKSKNEKLLLYAMLIHSKKYSNNKGIFFMTYNQMVNATGLGERTVRRLVNKLEDQGLIIIVERNRKVLNVTGNTISKKPNKYKINLNSYDIEESNCIIITDNHDFNNSLLSLIDINELHTILPRRHYEELKGKYSNT